MAYGLESLLKGEYSALLSGKKAAYIAPGTGLGGGFCEISEDGEIEFITDGQIFDLVLGPEFEFKFRHDGRDMRIDMKGTAEDIFSGRAIKEMMQKIDAEIGGRGIFSTLAARLAAESKEDYEKVMGGFLLSYIIEDRIKAPDEVKAIAEKMALFFGAGQAQIISSIYEGNINKRRADAQWNEDDKKAVRGIVNYVLGGSIATKGKLGRDLVAETNRILTATYPETKFNLIPIDMTSEDAGVLGAASFIVKEEAAKYIRSVSKPGLVSVIGTRIFEGSVWGMAVLPALNLASEAVKPVLDLAGIGERYGYLKVKGGSKTILETTIEKIQAAGDTGLDGNIESVRTEEEKIRDKIGYMPQRFSLYGDLTVSENIDFFADIYKVEREYRRKRKAELLEFMSLAEFVKRKGRELSGGMQKKLALACNLIHTPKLLFLDEPTTGVDPISRREFWRILYGLENVTIVVSTPYMDEAERCNRVGLIREGRLLLCDVPSEIKKRANARTLEEAFINIIEASFKEVRK